MIFTPFSLLTDSVPSKTFTYDFSFIVTPSFTKDNTVLTCIGPDIFTCTNYGEAGVTVPEVLTFDEFSNFIASPLYDVTSDDLLDAGGTLYLILRIFDGDAMGSQIGTTVQSSRTNAGSLTVQDIVSNSEFTDNVHIQVILTDNAPI